MPHGVNHHQILPVLRSAQHDPALLVLAVLIIKNRECQLVAEYSRRQAKGDAVLSGIGVRFSHIPLKMVDLRQLCRHHGINLP